MNMKKLISLLLTFVLLSPTVFANDLDDLKAVMDNSSKILSADCTAEMSITVNKPIKALETIPGPFGESEIDLRSLIESIISSNLSLEASYSVSEDYKKMKLSGCVTSDTPIVFNDSFKLNAWAKAGIWMEYDFTSAESPVYKVIYKLPFEKKYMALDMSEYFAENPGSIPPLNEQTLDAFRGAAIQLITDNAEISKSKGVYTLKFSDKSAKQYILSVFELSKTLVPADAVSDEASEQLDKVTDTLKSIFDKVTILGEDGMTMQITVSPSGLITAEEVSIHINLNIYDILTAFSKSTQGLAREDAFVDITLNTKETLSNHNKAAEITIPVLTEENTEFMSPSSYDFGDYKNFELKQAPLTENSTVYYPLDPIADKCGFTIDYSANKVRIGTNTSAGAVVLDTESAEVISGGETITLDKPPVILNNDEIYCTDAVLDLLNIYAYCDYDVSDNTFTISVSYFNGDDYEDDYEDAYVPDKLWYYINSDKAIYIEDNEPFMPAYDFFESLFPGTFSFAEGYIEYTADSAENSFGINTLSVGSGNSSVTVNGESVPLSKAAKEIDGVIRIPISFAQKLGLNCENVAIYYDSSYYSFVKDNPDYTPDPENYKNNWFFKLFDF